MRFWRICRQPYATNAFSGEGAKLAGGRWNLPGTAIAYTSEHLSLAALELFVNIGRQRPKDLVAIEAELPLDPRKLKAQRDEIRCSLPPNWEYDLALTRRLGDNWGQSTMTPVLFVPSSIIDVEWNILLNPLHPDLVKLRVLRSFDFTFDARMYKNEPQSI